MDSVKSPDKNFSFLITDVFHKLKVGAIIPTYIHDDDSGLDIYSCIEEDITLNPFERVLVSTGLTVTLPYDTELQVRSRSGLAINNGVIVLNSPGTIDEGYKRTEENDAELKICLINLDSKSPLLITNHMRVAQVVLADVIKFEMPKGHVYKQRAGRGFGSTGVK